MTNLIWRMRSEMEEILSVNPTAYAGTFCRASLLYLFGKINDVKVNIFQRLNLSSECLIVQASI